MKWTEEKIQKQKRYFKEQRINPTGKFTEFVVRTYYFIYKECSKSPDGLVKSSITNKKELVFAVYEDIYDKPDHMGREVVNDCVRNLKELGYIGFKKVENIWYIYIKKELDFLKPGEHQEYMRKYCIGDCIHGERF